MNYKEKLLLWKRYFETGYNITKYFLLLIGLFGLTSGDVQNTLFLGLAYFFVSFFIGWAYYRFDWYEIDTEIGNRFNPFVLQTRKKLKIKTTKTFK